jgi:hypothetical protein
VLRYWPDLQFINGKIHDLDIEHSKNQCKGTLNIYALRVALMHSKR